MKVLDRWYAAVSFEAIQEYFRNDPDMSARLVKKQKLARTQTSEGVVPKLTAVVGGLQKIKDDPPVLYHFQGFTRDFEAHREEFVKGYKQSLQSDQRRLYERFRYQESAVKVMGVGSVGTRCSVVLLLADNDDPLFLQVKEARRSVLEPPRSKGSLCEPGVPSGGKPTHDAGSKRHISRLEQHEEARLLRVENICNSPSRPS